MKLTQNLVTVLASSKTICIGAVLAMTLTTQAQTFSYNNGDVLIGFRNTAGGTYDLVINAGPVSTFTNLPVGNKITITSLTGSLLKAAFSNTNNLSWSVFANIGKTNFMSSPRSDLNTQSTPWGSYTATSQGNAAAKINGVGTGAYNIGLGLPASANNTTTALVEPESANAAPTYSYYSLLGVGLNWGGTFQGDPEQSTSATFTTDGQPVRADFYWLVPGGTSVSHPPGAYLGYFEFNTNGVLTYTSGPSASVLVTPQIVSITRVGTTSTVYFTTGSTGTYTLRASSDLTTPVASWATLTSVSGNGLTNSLQEIITSSPRYYRISAQ